MLREQIPHHVLISVSRNQLLSILTTDIDSLEAKRAAISELDIANEAYIRAKVRWSTTNTDETMIDLIGTWARLNKHFRDIEAKYGSKS